MIRVSLRAAQVLVLAAAALAAGCQSRVEKPAYAAPSFANFSPIRLNVAQIDYVREYQPPARAPNVDHLFPVPPMAAAEQWGRDRLRAVGSTGAARLIVRNASVVEVALKREGGIRGALTTEQSERYDAVLEVRVEIVDGRGVSRAMVSARAERSRSVPEDITLQGREKVWHEMTVAMMNDINPSLERQIRENFGEFVR